MGISRSNNLQSRSSILRLLAMAGVLGPVLFWGISFLVAVSQPGYSSVKNTISSLVFTQYGWLQTLDFCILGLVIIAFSLGLYSGIHRKIGLKLSLLLMVLIGFGTLLIGVFPTDPGPTISLHAQIHHGLVRGIGILYPISCFLMLPSLKSDPRWKPLTAYTAISGTMVFILVLVWILMLSSDWMDAWVGLYERVFVANAVIWLEIMALRLLFLPAYLENTERKIEEFVFSRLNREFWINLGESGRVIVSGLKHHEQRAEGRPRILRTTGYIAFSALLAATLRLHLKKQPVRQELSVPTALDIEPVLFWGVQGLGRRLGLTPVANLVLGVLKPKEYPDVEDSATALHSGQKVD